MYHWDWNSRSPGLAREFWPWKQCPSQYTFQGVPSFILVEVWSRAFQEAVAVEQLSLSLNTALWPAGDSTLTVNSQCVCKMRALCSEPEAVSLRERP